MAYPPPPAGYPAYGSHPQSTQLGYQQPHPDQYSYPPPGHSPYPQPQGFGTPPPGQFPPQGYPPQQAAYGQPQGYPPQNQFNQAHQGFPPQQQSHGAFPAQPPYAAQPQAPYHATQQPYGAPAINPTPPSPGYGPDPPMGDATATADALWKAMKGFGTNEADLISILAQYPAPLIKHLKQTYYQRHKRSLEDHVKSETSSYFRLALLSILRGPLQQDVFLLDKALKGAGTDETLLNDVLIARSNADMKIIKDAYQATYTRRLEDDVNSDLSSKTKQLFSMILDAKRQEDMAPVYPQTVDTLVTEIHRVTEAKILADKLTACHILSSHSDGQIRAISLAYEQKYRTPLEKVIRKSFSGHMETALVQMVNAAADRAKRDADLLEDTMAGLGTKDEMLISRLVRIHWDRQHMDQVKKAYFKHHNKVELSARIKGETSGNYQKLLMAMVA